jgi:predicted phosphodiesterase
MAKFLVLSDIHANLEALEAVLADAQERYGKPDQLWCLGDIVGYGPDPGPCIDLLLAQDLEVISVRGNHDQGTIDARNGNGSATSEVQQGWQWAASVISERQFAYLNNLPLDKVLTGYSPTVLLVHASPKDKMHTYLETASDIESNLDDLSQELCFFGHTHLACYFICDPQRKFAQPRLFSHDTPMPVKLPTDRQVFINPGTVGQPRWGRTDAGGGYQGEPRVSYIWLTLENNTATITCHYVAYDSETTISKMEALKVSKKCIVPDRWARRLREGLR